MLAFAEQGRAPRAAAAACSAGAHCLSAGAHCASASAGEASLVEFAAWQLQLCRPCMLRHVCVVNMELLPYGPEVVARVLARVVVVNVPTSHPFFQWAAEEAASAAETAPAAAAAAMASCAAWPCLHGLATVGLALRRDVHAAISDPLLLAPGAASQQGREARAGRRARLRACRIAARAQLVDRALEAQGFTSQIIGALCRRERHAGTAAGPMRRALTCKAAYVAGKLGSAVTAGQITSLMVRSMRAVARHVTASRAWTAAALPEERRPLALGGAVPNDVLNDSAAGVLLQRHLAGHMVPAHELAQAGLPLPLGLPANGGGQALAAAAAAAVPSSDEDIAATEDDVHAAEMALQAAEQHACVHGYADCRAAMAAARARAEQGCKLEEADALAAVAHLDGHATLSLSLLQRLSADLC